ncbi:MAG: hypothetical protein B6229_03085 [Spirochaetaceae bacterium 4572_7]|nr:MAG: hypothetical protein B6229_03085 [Spirochaetaceae bacterium 4572_7]
MTFKEIYSYINKRIENVEEIDIQISIKNFINEISILYPFENKIIIAKETAGEEIDLPSNVSSIMRIVGYDGVFTVGEGKVKFDIDPGIGDLTIYIKQGYHDKLAENLTISDSIISQIALYYIMKDLSQVPTYRNDQYYYEYSKRYEGMVRRLKQKQLIRMG